MTQTRQCHARGPSALSAPTRTPAARAEKGRHVGVGTVPASRSTDAPPRLQLVAVPTHDRPSAPGTPKRKNDRRGHLLLQPRDSGVASNGRGHLLLHAHDSVVASNVSARSCRRAQHCTLLHTCRASPWSLRRVCRNRRPGQRPRRPTLRSGTATGVGETSRSTRVLLPSSSNCPASPNSAHTPLPRLLFSTGGLRLAGADWLRRFAALPIFVSAGAV